MILQGTFIHALRRTTLLIQLLVAVGALQGQVPQARFRLDPDWPKLLPNNWIINDATGLFVDNKDHIWVVHRPLQVSADDAGAAQTPPLSECCVPAPSILEFDVNGNLLSSWGGQGFVPEWPLLEHGLFIDKGGNFWFGGNFVAHNMDQLTSRAKPKEMPPPDRRILKFSPDKKLLLVIGRPGKDPVNNQDTTILGAPSDIFVDDAANVVYIADGYLNSRIVVYDARTGAFFPSPLVQTGPRQLHDAGEHRFDRRVLVLMFPPP